MNHVMIDLETFGTRSQSVIVSVGAVQFDPHSFELGATFHESIDLKSAMTHGLKLDSGTIVWWLDQSPEARLALVNKIKTASSLATTLGAFRSFLQRVSPDVKVWGNGADFDLSLLQQAYEALGQEKPWKYNASRCYRTLLAEFGRPEDSVTPTLAHDALADAIAQAKTAQNIFARLRQQAEYAEELTQVKVGFIQASIKGFSA
jgi:exodeoxyribonuclease VIII